MSLLYSYTGHASKTMHVNLQVCSLITRASMFLPLGRGCLRSSAVLGNASDILWATAILASNMNSSINLTIAIISDC